MSDRSVSARMIQICSASIVVGNLTYIICIISYVILLLDFITLSRVQFRLDIYIVFVFIFVIYRLSHLFYAFVFVFVIVATCHLHNVCIHCLAIYLLMKFAISHSIIAFDHYIQYLLSLLVRSFIYLYDAYPLIFSIIIHTYSC